MKKIIALLLALCLVFALCACGSAKSLTFTTGLVYPRESACNVETW